jgi:4-aminobutyrate aminotransferase-like enzyme/Ser/Thr protein kinase RdoA (MazF antagonist)
MPPTVEGRPSLPAELVAGRIREAYGLEGSLRPLAAEWDQNFQLDTDRAGSFVVKLANAGTATEELKLQNAALDWLGRHCREPAAPQVVSSSSGQTICSLADEKDAPTRMRVLTHLAGVPLSSLPSLSDTLLERLGRMLGEVDRCLAGFEHPAMDRRIDWDLRRAEWISSRTKAIRDLGRRGLVERLLLQFRARVVPLLPHLPMSVIHNDANDENVLVEPAGEDEWRISGLLDFGDMVRTCTVCEPAVAAAYATFKTDAPLTAIATLAGGYHRARPLSQPELEALFPLVVMRLCVSVTTSANAAEQDPDNPHRQISDRKAWEVLERLEAVDWNEAENRMRAACGIALRSRRSPEDRKRERDHLFAERRRLIGPSLSLAYETPLEIVRGRGQFLFELDGRAYLDCVNNVCHVGHCHPRVIEALEEQAAILNTNTRYLHPLLTEYSRRLTATFPDPLTVCYFVNSGSEANELAVRIARTATGQTDVIVLDDAYHGNTQTLVELSPYKCEGPGGKGLPGWAHKVPKPDPYRGPHRGSGEEVGEAYAEDVRQICARLASAGRPPALFLVEPILGCGGQVVLPEGYLRHAFRHVRQVGGLCIADEVQVGMGRVGTHMWAFESHGVVPDIVTVGKPIGNGHPLAAVVTTREAARAFATGMEYFSTFGGNPVSMAVGLAVLEVIEKEGLQQHALRVGDYLMAGFRTLGERHPQIGDVRGQGLFIGVELVEDRESRTPASDLTARLIENLKADGILLSAEGPDHNVLKIKPPLVFAETDADILVGAIDRALAEGLGLRA